MDIMWEYRQAYQRASQIKAAQDAYCAKAEAGLWNSIVDSYPEAFQYEALVDVLRGRVKVNELFVLEDLNDSHFYGQVSQDVFEAVDLDAIVRVSDKSCRHPC